MAKETTPETSGGDEVAEYYGPKGEGWRQWLPGAVAELTERWSVRLSPGREESGFSFVAKGERADGRPVVLKVGFLREEIRDEAEALRLFAGRGVAELLEAEEGIGALLMERAVPGRALAEVAEEEAARIAAEVGRELWVAAPEGHRFPTVAKWGAGLERMRERFGGGTGPLPAAIVERAEGLLKELLASTKQEMLLHGDLHHYNILRGERRPWLVIDPKGVVGDPAYEIGMFMGNPAELMEGEGLREVLARRVAIFSEAWGMERERLRQWAVVQQVLSAWWSVEDSGEGWEDAITRAEMLAHLQ